MLGKFSVPISVTCSKCGHTLSVKDKYAGKKGLCPKCQATIQIPGPDDELKMAPLAEKPLPGRPFRSASNRASPRPSRERGRG